MGNDSQMIVNSYLNDQVATDESKIASKVSKEYEFGLEKKTNEAINIIRNTSPSEFVNSENLDVSKLLDAATANSQALKYV